jgi:hypothetical protein
MIPSFPSAFSMFFVFVTTGRSYHPGMGWFRKTAARDSLAVTMTGVKLGDRFLSVGVRDPRLIAAIATKSGLTRPRLRRRCRSGTRDGRRRRDPRGGRTGRRRAGAVGPAAVRERQLRRRRRPRRVLDARARWQATLRRGGAPRPARRRPRHRHGGAPGRTRVEADALTTPLKNDRAFAAVRVLAEAEGMIFAEGIKKA